MKFHKVSDKELKCIVTVDEIKERGLEVSDLLRQSDKTVEFFEKLIEEGTIATGFEKNGPMAVEGNFMNGKLEITFKIVDENEVERLKEKYPDKEFPPKEITYEGIKPDDFCKANQESAMIELCYIAFEEITAVINFIDKLENEDQMLSTLYELDGVYYLIIDLTNAEKETAGRLCFAANEYAKESAYGDLKSSYVLEHGKLICEDPVYKYKKQTRK